MTRRSATFTSVGRCSAVRARSTGLPRYIGLRRTKELLLTGKLLSGKQCAEWGLANVSAPTGQLEEAVAEFIAPLKDKSAFTMRITKLAANRGLDGDTETLIALESMTCNVGSPIQRRPRRRPGIPPETRTQLD